VFEKLVSLFEGRLGRGGGCGLLSWDQLVELSQEARLGDAFMLRWVEGCCVASRARPGTTVADSPLWLPMHGL
jgi:hypothetical protein